MEEMTIDQYREFLEKQKSKPKYGNRKTEIDGFLFDSAAESVRYAELMLLIREGSVSDLAVHPVFVIEVNGLKICSYEADFSYQEAGALVVEDVKGVKTKEYILKKKLMKAVHNIEIIEINV